MTKNLLISTLVVLIMVILPIRSEWTLGASDLTQNNFLPTDLNGWSDSRVYTCSSFDTLSMVGGYQNFSGQSSTHKVFSGLAPHFRIKVKFTLYCIDCVSNSLKNEAIKMKADSKEVFSFSPSSLISSQDFCGSNSFNDSVNEYTAEFNHSGGQLLLEFLDTFDNNSSNGPKSWGIRNIQIQMLQCFRRCATCSGDWSNQCLSCYENQVLNSNNECICQPGFYFQDQSCIPFEFGASDCEIQIFEEIDNIIVQESSIVVTNNLINYLRISITLSFAYTRSIIPATCINQINSKMMIRSKVSNDYLDFTTQLNSYILVNNPAQLIQLLIPLSVVSSLSQVQNKQGDQVYSVLDLAIYFGHQSKLIRLNRFSIYTSLGNDISKINTFATNIDEQVTDGCKTTNDDCVVIADLDLETMQCQDATCKSERTDSTYYIGDTLFIIMKFKYSKFAKFINKSTAFFKGDNIVLNFSDILAIESQQQGYTIFSLPLSYPSSDCLLQVTVNIRDEPGNRILRQLADLSPQSQQKQQIIKLGFTVLPKLVDEKNNIKAEQSKSSMLIGISWLVLLIISILMNGI